MRKSPCNGEGVGDGCLRLPEETGGGADNEGKGGRYETKKTRNKADVCRSDGGSYGAVGGGCERLRSDECEGGNCIRRECAGIIGNI